MERPYDVYFNLHKHCYSIIDRTTGRVVEYATELTLRDVLPVVQNAGRLRVIATKRKCVHAYLRCTSYESHPTTPPSYHPDNRVTYNPYRDETFVWALTRNRLGEMPLVYCGVDWRQKKPEVFAIPEGVSNV